MRVDTWINSYCYLQIVIRIFTTQVCHFCKNPVRSAMNCICAKCLRCINIFRIHPSRIRLFAPVKEGRFTEHQSGFWIHGILLIIFRRILNDWIGIAEPFLITCYQIHFPGSKSPGHPVGWYWPWSAGSSILNDTVVLYFCFKTCLRYIRIDDRQREQNTIADVTRPDAIPFCTRHKCTIWTDIQKHFFQCFCIQCIHKYLVGTILRIGRNILF